MRTVGKHALWGAVIGTAAVTVFATGEMLADASREGVPFPVTLILAMAMGGLLIGAPAGAVVGVLAGWARGRSQGGAPTPAEPAPTFAPPFPYSPPAQQPPKTPAAPEPTPTPTPAPERPALDREAVIHSANEVRKRMAEENERRRPQLLAPVKPAPSPVTRSGVDLRDPDRLNRVLDELDSLPGLESVAGQVRALANRVRLNEERKARGMKVSAVGMHAIFVGPPGTGKTTVARVWGRVLAATGLLPSGHVIETDRAGLVGQHVGETAQKAAKAIDSARGGVLFIDEAYSLTPDGPASNDFGSEAVDVLLKAWRTRETRFA